VTYRLNIIFTVFYKFIQTNTVYLLFRSTTGLFGGLLFLCFTFISIALYNSYLYNVKDEGRIANSVRICNNYQLYFSLIYLQIFFITDAFLYFLSIIACIYAFWLMRLLNFVDKSDESAELLDRILLVVGLCGELIFSAGKYFN